MTTAGSGHTHFLIISVLIAMFMSALEQTIVGPAMADIASQFGGGDLLTWVPTAYLMSATASAPILGALADIKGRRFAIYLAVGLFMTGSLVGALAPDLPVLVCARIIQGLGAGGLIAIPTVIIADRVPMRQRAIYSAYTSTIYAVAAIFGPIAGGFLTQYAHWSAIFWINIPLGLAVLAGVALFYGPEQETRSRPIDVLGAFLLVGGTLTAVMSLNTIVNQAAQFVDYGPWLAAAAAFWICFGIRMVLAKSPLLPTKVLSEPTIVLCALGLLCCTGANVGLSVYLPLYYQQAFGLSASQAGLAIIGFLAGVMSGAYIPPRLLLASPRYKRLVVTSSAVGAIGAMALALVLAQNWSLLAVEIATITLGLGIGSSYPIFTLATQNAAGRERMGAALGLLGFARAMGGTIGVATVGAVAVASGLTHTAASSVNVAAVPAWAISLVALGLLCACLAAMLALPPGQLDGYGKAAE